MQIIFSGKFLSLFICYVTIKYFSNEIFTNLSLFEQSFFWFFREYIYESFHITSEKFLMTNKEFRNICIFKSFRIIQTVFIWVYLSNIIKILSMIFILIGINLTLIYYIIDIYLKRNFLKFNFFLIAPLFLKLCFNVVSLYSKNDVYTTLYGLFGFIYLSFILVILISYLKLCFDLFNFNNYYFFCRNLINKNLLLFSLKIQFKTTLFILLTLTISIFYVLNSLFNFEVIVSNNFSQELLLISCFCSIFIEIL